MRKVILVNGKTYKPAELTFNNICRMEEMGASITEAEARSMSLLRAFLAISMSVPADEAGKELEAHIIGGGEITELAEALREAIDDSDFFQALIKNQEEKTPTMATEKKSK